MQSNTQHYTSSKIQITGPYTLGPTRHQSTVQRLTGAHKPAISARYSSSADSAGSGIRDGHLRLHRECTQCLILQRFQDSCTQHAHSELCKERNDLLALVGTLPVQLGDSQHRDHRRDDKGSNQECVESNPHEECKTILTKKESDSIIIWILINASVAISPDSAQPSSAAEGQQNCIEQPQVRM